MVAAAIDFTGGVSTLTVEARVGAFFVRFVEPNVELDITLRTNVLRIAFTETAATVTLEEPYRSRGMGYVDFTAGRSMLDVFIPRSQATDPITGAPQYRLIVVDKFGNRYAELKDAVMEPYRERLNETGDLRFKLKLEDENAAHCLVPQREVQVWRGSHLEGWFVLVRANPSGNGMISFQALEPDWYFGKRVVGLSPMPNRIANGSFEMARSNWSFSWVPGSIPASPPNNAIVATPTLNGGRALQLGGVSAVETSHLTISADVGFGFDSYVLTSAGRYALDQLIAKIKDDPTPHIHIEGHTDNLGSVEHGYWLGDRRAWACRDYILAKIPGAVITTITYERFRPIASNSTEAGRSKNRRAEIEYTYTQTAKGHKQYAGQTFWLSNTGKKPQLITLVGWCFVQTYIAPSKEGHGLYMQLRAGATGKVVKTAAVAIGPDTPKGRWIRMECSMEVPPDSASYYVDVRLFPPEGLCYWDEVSATVNEQLAFYDVDQTNILKGLVEHAQDPAMGKTDLNITTAGELSGKVRTREYPWIERQTIFEAIYELPTLADGIDVGWEFTPTTRTLRAYYPRKGVDRGYVLAYGSNVIDFGVSYDAEQIATRVIVQADGDGSDREEGVWTDTSLLDGDIYETVYNATPGSSVSSLISQAKRGVGRYGRPIIIPELVMDPSLTDELLDRVRVGDVVRVVISKGWIQVDQKYRVTERSIDPNLDQITYTVTPEDI